MIFNEARVNPNRIILDDLVRRRTAGELIDRATRLANFLTDEVGLATGDHVAMVIGNRVEFIEVLLATMFAGVYITPVNTHLTTQPTP
ncbi:MAG: AMP-binding protein [Ardenticatenaceae bacterium]